METGCSAWRKISQRSQWVPIISLLAQVDQSDGAPRKPEAQGGLPATGRAGFTTRQQERTQSTGYRFPAGFGAPGNSGNLSRKKHPEGKGWVWNKPRSLPSGCVSLFKSPHPHPPPPHTSVFLTTKAFSAHLNSRTTLCGLLWSLRHRLLGYTFGLFSSFHLYK